MKTLVFCLLSFALNAQVTNYEIGDIVDDFTVTDVEDTEHNLYTYLAEGKYVYIDFFFDTCVPCEFTTPVFNEFYDKYGCNSGDVFCISINNGTDTTAEVIAFMNTYGGPFNHSPAVSAEGGSGLVDTNFGINAYPTFCLIGPDMRLLEDGIGIGMPIGDFTVELLEESFPTGFEPPIIECILGTTDFMDPFDPLIFPTISNGSAIQIILNEQITSEVQIYNMLGKRIFQEKYNSKDILLNVNAAAGVYFINIRTVSNSFTKKILIK